MFLKFLISFALFSLVFCVALFATNYLETEFFGIEAVLIFFGIFFLYVLVSFFFFVVRPIRTVLSQMQLFMIGKKFKKLYTKRVDEVGVLAGFFNKVTEGFTEVAEDVKDRDRIVDELSFAAELQKEIFPKEVPSIDGIVISAKNRPATEIGGDSYDFIESGDKLYLYVGDVTGHGVTAGLIMAMVNAMISSFSETFPTAKDIIIQTNKHIKKYVKPSMYMTLVMLCWDKKEQSMSYVGAGHEHILIYRKDTGVIDDIVSGGTALGMIDDVSTNVQEKKITLGKGDMIVLYTDGITEAKNSSNELYGLENLKKCITDYASEYSATGLSHHIAENLSGFVGEESQLDDMTLLVVERT